MDEDNCKDLCKVGDKLFHLSKKGITEVTVIRINHYPHSVYKVTGRGDTYFNRAFGKTLFTTYEEAQAEAQKRERITKKRRLLKMYERLLNKKLNLDGHFIIK